MPLQHHSIMIRQEWRGENPNASTNLIYKQVIQGKTEHELRTRKQLQANNEQQTTTKAQRFGKQAKQDNKGVGLIWNTWRD